MKNQNLKELIANKWFDRFQNGLRTRFSAHKIEYGCYYKNSSELNSVTVNLNKDKIEAEIVLNDKGILVFNYSKSNRKHSESFKNCSTEDFHTMLAHAFCYLYKGDSNYHKDWYNSLSKIE